MSGKSGNQIIIIAGPNGAGKTTLAPHLLRDKLGLLEYVNADTIAQGLSAFQPEQAAFEAGGSCSNGCGNWPGSGKALPLKLHWPRGLMLVG